MTILPNSCVLLADRHFSLRDSIRELLETAFETVFTVADEASLLQGVELLMPGVVVIDLSLSSGNIQNLIARVIAKAPSSKILMLTVHDEPSVAAAAIKAGVHAVVLKRTLFTDLLPAVDAIRADLRYLSPDL